MKIDIKKFDGEKFEKKYNLNPETDFRVDGDNLICDKLPDLKAEDLEDCQISESVKKTTIEELEKRVVILEERLKQ